MNRPPLQKTCRILVVDDDSRACLSNQKLLKILGHQTHIAGSSNQAMMLINKNSYDIVIANIRIGGINGIELIKNIRRMTKYIFIFGIDSNNNEEIKNACFEAGMDEVLVKNLSLQFMENLLQSYLGKINAEELRALA